MSLNSLAQSIANLNADLHPLHMKLMAQSQPNLQSLEAAAQDSALSPGSGSAASKRPAGKPGDVEMANFDYVQAAAATDKREINRRMRMSRARKGGLDELKEADDDQEIDQDGALSPATSEKSLGRVGSTYNHLLRQASGDPDADYDDVVITMDSDDNAISNGRLQRPKPSSSVSPKVNVKGAKDAVPNYEERKEPAPAPLGKATGPVAVSTIGRPTTIKGVPMGAPAPAAANTKAPNRTPTSVNKTAGSGKAGAGANAGTGSAAVPAATTAAAASEQPEDESAPRVMVDETLDFEPDPTEADATATVAPVMARAVSAVPMPRLNRKVTRGPTAGPAGRP